MRDRVVYIAGPMTGIKDYNFPKFFEFEKKLKRLGCEVVNPARVAEENGGQELFVSDEKTREKVFNIEKSMIYDMCTSIVLLEGWEKSQGTREELKIALERNLEIIQEKDIYERIENENEQAKSR